MLNIKRNPFYYFAIKKLIISYEKIKIKYKILAIKYFIILESATVKANGVGVPDSESDMWDRARKF